MPDISAIAGAMSAFKTAKDIAQAMIALRDAAAFQAKLIEFQTAIIDAQGKTLAAQEEHAALIERIRELEKRVAEMEDWEREKQQYHLVKAGSDGAVYRPKPNTDAAATLHSLCANCYASGKKSFLQSVGPVLHCSRCSAKIMNR